MADEAAGSILPPLIRAAIKARAMQSHTQQMRVGTTNIQSAGNIVRHSVAKFLDEPTPAASRAMDKVMRLPRIQPRPAGIPVGTPAQQGAQVQS